MLSNIEYTQELFNFIVENYSLESSIKKYAQIYSFLTREKLIAITLEQYHQHIVNDGINIPLEELKKELMLDEVTKQSIARIKMQFDLSRSIDEI